MTSIRPVLLRGAPVRLVVVLAVATAVSLGCGLAAALALGSSTGRPPALALGQLVAAALVLTTSGRIASWRARAVESERAMWRWTARALAVLAAAVWLDAGLELLPGAGDPVRASGRHVVFSTAVLAACCLLYQGLVRWNRFGTSTSDPGDWLNGVSAVLVLTAMLDLVLSALRTRLSEWPTWELQAWLLGDSAVLILIGTASTVVFLGGLVRDPRVWVLTSALAVAALGDLLSAAPRVTGTAFVAWPQSSWALAAAAIAGCAVTRPHDASGHAATTAAPTAGSLLVLAVSVGFVAVCTRLDPRLTLLPTIYACLAAIGVGTRATHLIRSLSLLAQTRQAALTDDLTGLANRRSLTTHLERLCASGAPVGLLVVDLDQFKQVNDRFGHATGDELLRRAADRLRVSVGELGLTARLGGDEFAVALPHSSVPAARALADRIDHESHPPLEVEGRHLRVRGSIGVTVGLPGTEPEQLLRQADAAMYVAKGSGGGVSLYDEAAATATARRDRRLDQLRVLLGPVDADGPADRARDAGELAVFFQPQVEAGTGLVTGAEALVRWRHPESGVLPPADFLDLVEQHGLIGSLTTLVLGEATRAAVRWQRLGHDLRVAVNLSTSCLAHPQFLAVLDDALAGSGLEPARLVLEITETTIMADPAQALAMTQRIADRGIGISIDDYGTGYSSLAYLNDVPADELKIDRSFTERVARDGRTAAIVAGTTALARRLGLRVVCEGVEDQRTLAMVEAMGADETQGYLHSRPLAESDFVAWLTARGDPGHRSGPRLDQVPAPGVAV